MKVESFDLVTEALEKFDEDGDFRTCHQQIMKIIGSAKIAALDLLWGWMNEESLTDKDGIHRRMVTPYYSNTDLDLPLLWPILVKLNSGKVEV
jgi:hypothetical protein